MNSFIETWPIDLPNTKYKKWYESLMLKSKNRILSGYTEKHHIIPRSFGGSNNKDNIAILTAREHYIAHLLLWKMPMPLKWHNKMTMALHVMVNGSGNNRQKIERANYIVNSKLFETYRKEWVSHMSETRKGENNHFYGKKHSIEAIEKIKHANARTKDSRSNNLKREKNPMWGKAHTIETKALLSKNCSAAWTDEMKLKKSEELKLNWKDPAYRAAQVESRKSRWANTSEEERKRIAKKALEKRIANGNMKVSEETRKKMSLARKGRPASNKGIPVIKQTCPHCFKLISGQSNFVRWHGVNCKDKQ